MLLACLEDGTTLMPTRRKSGVLTKMETPTAVNLVHLLLEVTNSKASRAVPLSPQQPRHARRRWHASTNLPLLSSAAAAPVLPLLREFVNADFAMTSIITNDASLCSLEPSYLSTSQTLGVSPCLLDEALFRFITDMGGALLFAHHRSNG